MTLLLSPLRCASLIVLLFAAREAQAGNDWLYWAGPSGKNISDEVNLPDRCDPRGGEGSNLIWSVKIGSRSTPTAMEGRLYLLTSIRPKEGQNPSEKLICLEAETGKRLWEVPLPTPLQIPVDDLAGTSVACDPASGYVYAQGADGDLYCVNGRTGTLVWHQSFTERFGIEKANPGPVSSPLVFENNVITNAIGSKWTDPAKSSHLFLALDTMNGMPAWVEEISPVQKERLSIPVIGIVDGEQQMVCLSSDGGIHSFQPRTGKNLWSCTLSSTGSMGIPLIAKNKVYCGYAETGSGSARQGSVVCLDATQRGDLASSRILWKKTGFAPGRSGPRLIDDRLYFVTNDARLICLDANTGEEIGKSVSVGTKMHGNMLVADGKIYLNDVQGRGSILKPTAEGVEVLQTSQFPSGEKCYGSPIAVKGRIYISTTGAFYCFGQLDAPRTPQSLRNVPRETHVALDEKPAWLQVVPAESWLSPGTRQVFHGRLYNGKGQYLRNARPEELQYELTGPGQIDVAGVYTILPGGTKLENARLTVRFNGIEGSARLRIVPETE